PVVLVNARMRRAQILPRRLLAKAFDLVRGRSGHRDEVFRRLPERHAKPVSLAAALLDLRSGPVVVMRPLVLHAVFRGVDLPDRVALVLGRKIEEESAQREAPPQFGREGTD